MRIPRRVRHEKGFTLVEIVVALGILVVAIIGLVSVIAHTTRHNAVNRENQTAMRAAEKKIEEMVNSSFATVFTTFSATGAATFDVPPLLAPTSGTKVGTIRFPGAGGALLELGSGAFMGMAADLDLDGNGAVTSGDVSTTYQILPLEIEMTWKGIHGERTLRYRHMLFQK